MNNVSIIQFYRELFIFRWGWGDKRNMTASTTHLKSTGELGSESLSEIRDGVVQVQHRGVLQPFGLVDDGLDHIGVAVPAAHRSNPSERVQVPFPLLVEQVLLLPFHHVQLQPTTTHKYFS